MLKLNQVIIPLEAPLFVPNPEEDGTDWDFERIETSYYQINEEVSEKNSRSESYNINQSFDDSKEYYLKIRKSEICDWKGAYG